MMTSQIPPLIASGAPTPIAGLPDAALPLLGGSMIPLDVTQGGPTAKTTLSQLAAFVTGGGGNVVVVGASDLTTPGPTGNLPATGGNVYVHNSASSVLLIPPPSPVDGLVFTILDADGTAGIFPIAFQGLVGGVTNPVLLDFAYGSAALQFHSGNWYRIR